MNDLKFAFRQLLKNPGFTAVAVLTLALGIGANTAIFTVINSLLLRSLPVKHPGELVQAFTSSAAAERGYTFSYPAYERLQESGRHLSGLFAASGVGLKDRLIAPGRGAAEAEFVRAQGVSGNFFSVLGVSAMVGRTLTTEDDRAGAPQSVAVISYSFWQRRFGGDSSVVGKTVTFNDVRFTIVGVTPPGFFGYQPGENPELWWPLQMTPRLDGDLTEKSHWLRLMGRLSPGVRRRQAEAELAVSYQHYGEEYAAASAVQGSSEARQRYFGQKLQLASGSAGWTKLRQQFRQPLLFLMAVVVAVLLIVCANVASLLLARAAVRQREFSIRGALGAGQFRLVRQLLAESVLLAAFGGLLGLLFAQAGTQGLQTLMRLPTDPVSLSVAPDVHVLLFTIAVSLMTSLIFGLAPAFWSSRPNLASALKGAVGNVAGSALRRRPLQTLVVVQVAFSVVLLIGAGLLVRTVQNLKGLDAGFNRENVVLFNIDFAQQLDHARRTAFYKELLARLETLPGVRTTSLFNYGLLSGISMSDSVTTEGYVADPGENLECAGTLAGPRFFETFGISLLSGRDFGTQDERLSGSSNTNASHTAVINQAMARRYFGEASPLGRRFYFTHQPEMKFEIVGVVADAKYGSLREPSSSMFYLPYFQEARGDYVNFALRVRDNPQATLASLPNTVRGLDRTIRVRDLRTMTDVVNASVLQERMVAQLGGAFGVLALGLDCLGLYGVLSMFVAQRTREIGVRVAVGAQRWDVLSLVLGEGLKLALAGALIGLVGAMAAMRLVSSLLYGVTTTDPMTFAGAPLLLMVIAALASWLPARRAAKVDPIRALRYD
jgi:predicted permease